MMSKYVILSEKKWHEKIMQNLKNIFSNDEWILINNKSDFNISNIKKINPDKIFIPHWSYIVPENIYSKYVCIVFHMTDLPYGRGGSPLQNLIIRGHDKTKITAIKIDKGVDTGDIYLKKDLNLNGTANEIFLSANPIIENMIIEIIEKNMKPQPQIGEVVEFQRRKPEESNISLLRDIDIIYDYIRMLDCDGYPKAFIENDSIKIEFSNVVIDENKNLNANVRIFKK